MIAVGVSVLGIAASGVAWLAAVAVLALIASRPEGSGTGEQAGVNASARPAPSSATLPPIEAAAVRPQEGTALVVERPPATEPRAAEPEVPEPQQVPVAFPSNTYEPTRLGPFPAFVDLVRNHEGLVRLTGHTDSRGPEEVNYSMGLGRAWAVQKLLTIAGIEVVHVPIASKGETEPIADNATAEGRAANRRVTAEFFAPGEVAPEP